MAEMIAPEAAVKEEKTTATGPEMAQEDLIKKVQKLLKQSNLGTQKYRQEWSENYRFVVEGKQWSIRRPKWRFSEVINITWANIMTEVGIQTDSRPRVDFSAVEPSDFQFAEMLKQINDVNWNKPTNRGFGWQAKVAQAVFKSKLYHVVHAEVCWDKELEDGIGDIGFKILDPYGCYWDPVAKNISEARYFIYTEPRPVSELKHKYPEQADKIKADVSFYGGSAGDGIDDHDIDLYFTASGPINPLSGNGTDRSEMDSNQFGGEEMALLIRCWIKDEEVLESEEEGEDGKKSFVKKLKYPKGRYIEMVNKTILKDEGEGGEGENIYEDGLFPICTLVNYDYGEYAGENEVTHQKGPQKLVNYTLSHIMDQFKMGSNPQKIVSHRAADIANKLTNEPGLVVTVPETSDIRMEAGVGIASGSFNLLDSLKSFTDAVSGLYDATKGAPQPGVTSGLMLEGFVEAAQTRPRLKNRSVDDFLTQVGYLMASRYLEYYKAPRVFRITNQQGFPEFVEFFIAEDGQGGRVANMTRSKIDDEGKPIIVGQGKMPVKGLPDVQAVTGSNLPFAKAQKTATALDLHGRGLISSESLLEAINWPNPQEEVEKAKAEQQEMAQQQAAMQPQQ